MDPRSLLHGPAAASSPSASLSSSLPRAHYGAHATHHQNGGGTTRKLKRIPRYLEGFVSEQEQTAALEDADAEETNGRGSNGKRVKVARACLFCKRSHMSCEDQRPCSRCIARGIGDRCCDTEADTAAAQGNRSSASPSETLDRRPSLCASRRMSPPRAPSSSELSEPSPQHRHHFHQPHQMDATSPGFDAMLAFLGTMDAATAAWGPVPADGGQYAGGGAATQFNDDHVSWSSLTHMTDDHGGIPRIMTPSAASTAAEYQRDAPFAPPAFNDNIAPPPASHTRTSPSSSEGGGGAMRRASMAARIDNSTLTESSKPFISGQLAEYDDGRRDDPADDSASTPSLHRRQQRDQPWAHVLEADFTASDSLEDSIVRPYQYAYGYTRIERWIRSPLSGWSASSADRAQAVLNQIRPLFRNRWAQLTDLQLVQHEERYETIVDHYRKHVCEAVPVPMVVIRRTCEIVCANAAFAKLCNTDKQVFASGRLCLYQLMEQACMVAIFEKLGDLFQRDSTSSVHLDGQVRFSCAAAAANDAGGKNGEEHVAAASSSPATAGSTSTQPRISATTTVQLRHVRAHVVISLEAIFDEHLLPLCLVCTLTPTTTTTMKQSAFAGAGDGAGSFS